MMLVIDASVVIKWFIEEKDSAKALLLKDNHINSKTILIAPDLLIYEVANVLLFSKIFTPLEIKGCLQDLYELEIDLINPSIDFVLSAIELAFSKQISIYDASYLALAKELDTKLITADKKLYTSANEPNHIELLSDI
ncbi:MAG TPA: type II toxin-antitoxin system VapC family toxin [Candidatus Brocadiia bacterium]|nr:type II toxin-antitoxin system VapC family toxin [Candidatus Brocadiales bacterium]